MLKANFKITENGGSGVVQLQSSPDNTTWQDMADPLTLSGGQLTVDDTANIAIDTTVFTPGQTFYFRLVDLTGSPVSNVVSYTIHTILSQCTGTGHIGFTPTTGDNYEMIVHATPDSANVPAGYTLASITYYAWFWQQHNVTDIVTAENVAVADATIPMGGHGAGIYQCEVDYSYTDSTGVENMNGFAIVRYIKVDGNGNILADIQLNGVTVDTTTELTTTQTAHIIQTGVTYPIVWIAYGGQNGSLLGYGDTATLQIPADTGFIITGVICDAVINDDVDDDLKAMYHTIRLS